MAVGLWTFVNAKSRSDRMATQMSEAPYQLFPALDDAAYAALKEDIAERGVLVPVEYDESGAILDGHHRVKAWCELRAEGIDLPDFPRIVRVGLGDEAAKRNHVRALNLMRRHLDLQQRNQVLLAMRADGATYRQIAESAGLSVEGARYALNQFSSHLKTDSVIGKDGKTYPARKPRSAALIAPNQQAQARIQRAIVQTPALIDLAQSIGAIDASTLHALDKKRHTDTAQSVILSKGYIQVADESETIAPADLDAVSVLAGVQAAAREHRRIERTLTDDEMHTTNIFLHVWHTADVRTPTETLVLLALLNPHRADQYERLDVYPPLLAQKTRLPEALVLSTLDQLGRRGVITLHDDDTADIVRLAKQEK